MKKRIFSGIQPSGNLHIGNYLGAIQNWVKLQEEYDSIFCVVDMHAITVPQDPEVLRKRTIEIAKIYLAAGIDPKKCAIFIQSHVSEHAELCWILNTIARNSDLSKMTQFKDKTGIQSDFNTFIESGDVMSEDYVRKNFPEVDSVAYNKMDRARQVSLLYKSIVDQFKQEILAPFNKSAVGLFDYPVLMAADIILYDTQVVPVGKDQKQHIELARTLAQRFNHKFGETFIIPEAYTKPESENIMGLDDPTKKMSKSAKSEYNYIALNDDAETVRRKIKKAVTDSGSEIVYSDDKPALKNLINIYSLLDNKTPKEVEKLLVGKKYSDFKTELAEIIIKFLEPFQKKMGELSDEKVLKILEDGAKKVRPLAKKKLDEVKKKVGFVL
ncbi:MAG: tryptophan--tRNA ligase [Candidatus Moranbacteria bacterium]|nr:tryptophan--tRNA ligase [Candidatus Moranbacteria bacterium]